MTATCTHCDTTFRGVDRDEDGRPYFESTRCASPGCEVYLCGAGCESLSFACDGCGARFCLEHIILVPDGTPRPLKCCAVCAGEVERIAPVPIRPREYQEVA
jgi:hypothetical protein